MSQPAPEDVYVLSPMQQGLLFHSLYAPDEQLYVDQLVLEIEARLDPGLLAAAWQRVVARHPALRTSFHWQGLDKPLQVVHREVTVPFAAHDRRGEPRRRVDDLLEDIRRRGFQLGRPPLLRLDWVWTSETGGLLAWTYHHILLDAWSASVVLAEVTAVYQALAGGGEAELPPARRFADYIAWLRLRDAGADEPFWRARLAGFRVPTPLVMERHGVNGAGKDHGAHGERGLALEREVSAALAGFARRHQLTLNTLVQGAWAALLHRTSGEPEVMFGATVSGRPAEVPGIESMVGLFINTLPVRTRWPDTADAVSWLREVQAWQLAVQSHAYDPLAEIQRWSEVPAGRQLFDSIVVFENVPEMSRGPAPDGALALRGQRYVSRTHYPLSLLVVPGDRLTLRATFERRRFEDTAVARHLGHLANLLRGLAGLAALVPGTPAPRLGALPLLSAVEHHQLLCEWQDRPPGPPTGAPLRTARTARQGAGAAGLLHRLVAERARAAPEAVALVEAETGLSLTYAELDRRTARLAHRLRALGIGPEVPVVVAVERSAAAVVALLAVLAADGVYVPVEPAVPAARLAFVLADTGAPVLLAGPRLELPPLPRERAPVRLDPASPAPPDGEQEAGEQEAGEPAAAAGPGDACFPPRAAPEGLAYVIYTSGSTGVPKGVAVSHQAAAAHFAAAAGEYGIEPGERVLQFASFAFDAGLEQIFTCLLRGATLVLRGEEVWDTADLAGRLARLRIAVANLPTSYWSSWSEALARPTAAGAAERSTAPAAARPGERSLELRLLIAGGEAMPAAALAAWHGSALAGVRLLNAYGPTEALVTATLYPVPGPPGGGSAVRPAGSSADQPDRGSAEQPGGSSAEQPAGGSAVQPDRGFANQPGGGSAEQSGGGLAAVPLGRALAGRTAYVLDRGLEPLPAGAPGELCLGGRLARGYLGRPDLTAASFVPDPFGGAAGGRLYRTGDRVRLLPDGRLEFLGRIDRQLKVRGVRVEPGEIEAALALHPGVAEAAVLTHDAGGGPVLVAFVVPRRGARPAAAELRDFLRRRLPAAWIPAAFSLLERSARTAGGKLDRRALPAWDAPAARRADGTAPTAGTHGAGAAGASGTGRTGGGDRRLRTQAPRNPVEELLASLWSVVLGVPAVGIHDDFFAAGGHSLLAMRLLSRVREAFAVELPLASLFAAPTVAGQAGQVLAALAAQDGPADEASADVGGGPRSVAAAPPLTPAPRDAPLPLSFAQQRLWILDQFDPGLPAYNIPVALRLAGTLSPAAMAAALTALAARHEPLRTRFEVLDERPVQRVEPAGPVPLPITDLRRLPASRRQAELMALAHHDAVRRFALARGPLLRAGLVLLGAADQALLLAVHHIAADAWSIGILLAELAELYAAATAARPAALPPLPVQYADYAVWQRAWLDGPVLERQLAFWCERLAGLPAGVPLPIDRPRPPLQTYRGARLPVRLDAAAAARVRELAGSERATLFMALLAACAELLARYSGHADLAIGTPVANRGRLETEGLIGFFVNTLVLRLDLAGDPTVRQLVGRAREATIASTVHQEVPFEKLVEELSPERSLSLTPFFQVLFTLDNPPPVPELPGLAAAPLAVETGTAKFDLTLALSDLAEAGETAAGETTAGGPGGGAAAPARRTRRTLAGGLEFNTDLFDPATAARLAGHYANLVAAFAANPERPAASLPLLAASERHQLLVEWNDTPAAARDASPAAAAPLHRRFERQAAATPRAPALIAGGETLTYRELDRHASRLARRLVGMGVGPEVTAAIFLERTPELIVALLAVLKAGGAYVPLDPAYPRERLAATLADCGAPVVLTQEWLAERLPASAARQVLLGALSEDGTDAEPRAEGEHEVAAALPGMPPEPPLDSLAYLIYTSGSTGRPKGVAITHRAAGAFLDWALARFEPAELATVFASTSICFDLSVFEIFAPLSAGGRIHLAGSGLDLLTLGEGDHVTLVNTVPSLLAEVASRGLPASVRTLNLAGEPIPLALAERLAAVPTLERVWNLYGPSEVTTYATAGALAAADLAAGRQPPIGRPIAGTAAYLLDGGLRAVPVGATGEMHLGGRGLARGYHRRPDLTAAAFIPNPLGDPGSRLYRTGDLARALPDGRLEFLGRRDAQVKVRGFRIEPGEIEAALTRHPGVAQAVVVPRPDGTAAGGGQRLVAYVVPPPGRLAGAPDELRAFLRRSLPDFMIPAAFVELGTVPLLPNGKVDRAALPGPETARRPAGAVEPRTDLERAIAAVLAEVLGVDRLALDENFFDLGGHSLAMIRAAGILEQRLGRTLPVLDLFRFPTVAALAGHLGGGEPSSPSGAAHAGEEPGAGRQPGRRRRREARSELDPVGR
jgi:amino acid adenylation domain-containing protein